MELEPFSDTSVSLRFGDSPCGFSKGYQASEVNQIEEFTFSIFSGRPSKMARASREMAKITISIWCILVQCR